MSDPLLNTPCENWDVIQLKRKKKKNLHKILREEMCFQAKGFSEQICIKQVFPGST